MRLVTTKATVEISSEEMRTVFHFCEILRDLEADDLNLAMWDILEGYSPAKDIVETGNVIFKIK